jgi:uncharacterized protein (DUF697 family)
MATTAVTPVKEEGFVSDAPLLTGDERLAAAEKIVRNNMYWSMGLGSVPVPIIDLIGVGGFQIRMIKDLSHLYGVKFSEHAAKNIITALIGSIGARALTVVTVGSLIKSVPGIGAVVGGIMAMPLIAGAATYAVGRCFVKHFEGGGTFLDFNTEKAKSYFSSQFSDGKKLATEKKSSTT